jgi:Uncharacterized protein conserved in bacteria (DUF2330)
MIFIQHRMLALAALLLVVVNSQLLADGKVYMKLEEVPATIPYQRAAIFFDQGKQTLILQSQYEIPGQPKDTSMAWIVPVPSVPEIASSDADITDRDTFFRLDVRTAPKVTRISTLLLYGFLILWVACLVLVPLLFVLSFYIKSDGFKRFIKRSEMLLTVIVFSGVILFISSFFFASAGVRGSMVEILKSEKAGIHDVQVLKAAKAGELIDWFQQNGFHSGPEDETAIQSYIDRGWCFVASRIAPINDSKESGKVFRHLLAPLILTFDTPHPVYPTALTATGGYNTEILLYLATTTPFATNAPIQLRGHSNTKDDAGYYSGPIESMEQHIFSFQHLSKYKSTLTPAQMASDIEFLPGPPHPDYRENVFAW